MFFQILLELMKDLGVGILRRIGAFPVAHPPGATNQFIFGVGKRMCLEVMDELEFMLQVSQEDVGRAKGFELRPADVSEIEKSVQGR